MSLNNWKSYAILEQIQRRKDERKAKKKAKRDEKRRNPTKAQLRHRLKIRQRIDMDRYIAGRADTLRAMEDLLFWPPFDFGAGLRKTIDFDWKEEGF